MLLGTYVTDISFVVQFLIALVGLGVAVDYSLLVVNRWREERAHGRDNHDAVVVAMEYAGHAVVASAGTVAISLCALLVIPVPLLRSMGIGGMLIPLVSTAVILTLLPALLGSIGPRVDWPRIRHEGKASRAWTAWARLIVRWRWVAVGTALVILGALIIPIFGIKIGQAQTDSLASGGPAYEQLQTLRDGGVPGGIVSPMEVLIEGADSGASADTVADRARGVDGVAMAFAPDNDQWRTDDAAVVGVIPTEETVDSTKAHVVDDVSAAIDDVPGVVGIAGVGPTVLDYINAVYKKFPYSLGLIALVTFVLLVRTFRSILLPVKAVLLNVVSVAATFGATVLFWQEGHGSEQIFGIAPTGAVTFWLPVLIFAFLFGLSMDYEVFILARMREEYDKTGDTDQAVVAGLARTGRLVTGAAMILFLSFLALASSPGTDIKVFATALGIGILLDATVVRALLVPALVSLFGRWNWWIPSWAATAVAGPAARRDPGAPPAGARAGQRRRLGREVAARARVARPELRQRGEPDRRSGARRLDHRPHAADATDVHPDVVHHPCRGAQEHQVAGREIPAGDGGPAGGLRGGIARDRDPRAAGRPSRSGPSSRTRSRSCPTTGRAGRGTALPPRRRQHRSGPGQVRTAGRPPTGAGCGRRRRRASRPAPCPGRPTRRGGGCRRTAPSPSRCWCRRSRHRPTATRCDGR